MIAYRELLVIDLGGVFWRTLTIELPLTFIR